MESKGRMLKRKAGQDHGGVWKVTWQGKPLKYIRQTGVLQKVKKNILSEKIGSEKKIRHLTLLTHTHKKKNDNYCTVEAQMFYIIHKRPRSLKLILGSRRKMLFGARNSRRTKLNQLPMIQKFKHLQRGKINKYALLRFL